MIFNMIKKVFKNRVNENHELDYGRHLIIEYVSEYLKENPDKVKIKILDIGVGEGKDIDNIRDKFKNIEFECYGIDYLIFRSNVAEKDGIKIHSFDIERNEFPFENNMFDIIICNQTLEHIKEIYWVFHEIFRLLKINESMLIIGIPNLLVYYNRILMLFGKEPTNFHVFGNHVRGMTMKGFVHFVEMCNFFKVEKIFGSNMYPFKRKLAIKLSKRLPSMSNSLYFKIKKIKEGNYYDILSQEGQRLDYCFFTGVYSKDYMKF